MITIRYYARILIPAVLLLQLSCVSVRQYREAEENSRKYLEERDFQKSMNQKLTVQNTELSSRVEGLQKELEKLAADSLKRYDDFMKLRADYYQMMRDYRALQSAQETMIKGSSQETSRLLKQLQTAQEDLLTREQELQRIELNLQSEKNRLEQLRYELEKKDARLTELEEILGSKDSVVNELKYKVSEALLGFKDDGLSVDIRNGKVYISMEEKLLFRSGSFAVDPYGELALEKLAKILEQNRDINIMIEGHTDDVPYIPNFSLQDNWDLSVKRATSIVRILLSKGKIDPKRLTAAGRGEFFPIDPGKTEEARRRNRRTEIILTPRLDELFRILESQ